jgi:phosphohistidine phosphatase
MQGAATPGYRRDAMRTLLLMRHAKASWDSAAVADHDRGLDARGREDAARMGALLVTEGQVPDEIFCSTAVRARETVALLSTAFGGGVETSYFPELYLATPLTCLAVAATASADSAKVLVVAHNPGLAQLAAHFSGAHTPMPTAAILRIEFEIDAWRELGLDAPTRHVAAWRPQEPA